MKLWRVNQLFWEYTKDNRVHKDGVDKKNEERNGKNERMQKTGNLQMLGNYITNLDINIMVQFDHDNNRILGYGL